MGRTLPVSVKFTDDQREIRTIYAAAVRAGVKVLRDGTTEAQVFEVWNSELQRHRAGARNEATRQAIARWPERKNAPFREVHTMNLDAGQSGPGRREQGTTVDFEPDVTFWRAGYCLEGMFLIT